jgi:phosphatidylglycerophosphate synthase
MSSVILDYFDGIAARRYNQCTFFGEVFDWITDIFNYTIVLLWWNQLEPQLLFLFGTLLCLEVVAMMSDIITKCYGYHPKLTTDHWSTYMLKFTMKT